MKGGNMYERIPKFLALAALSSFLFACSNSKPAETPANASTTDAKNETAAAPASPAAVETPASPKPETSVRKSSESKSDAKSASGKTAKNDVNDSKPAPQPVAVAETPAPAPAPAPAPVNVAPAPVPAPVAAAPIAAPAPPAPTTREIMIPSGTLVALRMIDAVDSKTDHEGQTFKASLDAPVIVDGLTVIPKGSDVFVKLTKVESAGNLKGTSEINLQLDRLYVNGKAYPVSSDTYQSVGASQGKKAVKQTGIGAGIGAVIGAIAGGKKGAAIGAGVGGGAGAATTAIQNGEQVRVEPEAKLTFRLEQPLNATILINGSATPTGRAAPLAINGPSR